MLRKINGLVSKTFTLEQKSGFKLERNKDLTFIVIIIDIDWYENNYRDNFFGHIAQPYLDLFGFLVYMNKQWVLFAKYILSIRYVSIQRCKFDLCAKLEYNTNLSDAVEWDQSAG